MTALQPDAITGLALGQTDPRHERADRVILIGAVLVGSLVLGPVGVGITIYGLVLLRRLEQQGVAIRPWPVTIMGLFCILDAGFNWLGWGLDLFLHDSSIARTFFLGYGRDIDNAYLFGYNTLSMGGTALVSEKILELAAVTVLFPMRIVGAYAFLKMKRWGFQVMVITAWLYVFLWIAYVTQTSMYFEHRFATSSFGVLGWWVINGPFIAPFVMLPWLYTVNRELWSE